MKAPKLIKNIILAILFILTFLAGSAITFYYRINIEKMLKGYLPTNCGTGVCNIKTSPDGIESCYCKGKAGRAKLKCCGKNI